MVVLRRAPQDAHHPRVALSERGMRDRVPVSDPVRNSCWWAVIELDYRQLKGELAPIPAAR